MRLKAMEKIDESKDKKHTGKLTDNPKDRTPYITCQMGHTLGMRTGMRLCSIRRPSEVLGYLRLSNRRPMDSDFCLVRIANLKVIRNNI